MATVRLASPADPRVADYRGVRDPDLLRTRKLFVAEGREVVRRLIRDSHLSVRSVLVNEAALAALDDAIAALPAEVPVYVAPTAAFEAIAGVNIHRGCLALGERPGEPPVDALLERARSLVVVEGVGNADNVGGIFRNAAAFGVDAVLMDPATCDPLYRKAIRTSAGASLLVPFARLAPWPAALERVRAAGFTLVATSPGAEGRPIAEFARESRGLGFALVLGAEGHGLSSGALERADARVRIPMTPVIDSLNVAVACGIVLSHLMPGASSSRKPEEDESGAADR